MELELTIIMLYARPYSIQEGNTVNQGVTVQYIITDKLDPVSKEDEKGIRVTKGSLSVTEGPSIVECPALYKGQFTMKTGADGKAVLKLESVRYISDIFGEVK